MGKNSTKKNFILYYLYQVTILLSTIVTTPYISKILGSEKLGIYSYTFSIANLLYIFAQLGTSTYGVREIALNKDNKSKLSKTFLGIELMTIFTTISCILIYFIVVNILGNYQFNFYIWVIFIIAAAFDVTWFYAGIEHFEEIFIINIIVRLSGIFAVAHDFVPVFFGNDFLPVETLLKLMTPLIVIPAISYILEYEYLMPAGKSKKINKYVIITALINIVLNIFFINAFKSVGAVITSIITEVIILICFFKKSDMITNTHDIFLVSYKKIISGLVMMLCIYFSKIIFLNSLANNILVLVLEIFIGIITYILSLMILKDPITNFHSALSQIQ